MVLGFRGLGLRAQGFGSGFKALGSLGVMGVDTDT